MTETVPNLYPGERVKPYTPDLRVGDTFTQQGYGLSARGLPVEGGRFVHNGRKAKVKTLTVFTITWTSEELGRRKARTRKCATA